MRVRLLKRVAGGHPTLRRAPKGGLQTYRGGWFIPGQMWQAEKRKAVDALPGLLQSFGSRMQFLRTVYLQQVALAQEPGAGKVEPIPLTTVEAQMKQAIRETYASALRLGKRSAGNLASVTADEQKWLKRLRLDEFRYLRGFVADMHEGRGKMAYDIRMDMYRAAAREAFWLGWVLGNRDTERRIKWLLGPTEHCSDCLRIADMGEMAVSRFLQDVLAQGFLPKSGRLECKGYHCQCTLVERFDRG